MLADDEVEASASKWHRFCGGLHEREADVVLELTAVRGSQLFRAEVDADRACARTSQGDRKECGATAELHHVETTDVTDEDELLLGLPEQAPSDAGFGPLLGRVGVGEGPIDVGPERPVAEKAVLS